MIRLKMNGQTYKFEADLDWMRNDLAGHEVTLYRFGFFLVALF